MCSQKTATLSYKNWLVISGIANSHLMVISPFPLAGRPLNATRSVLVGSSTQLDCGEGERKEWSKNGQPLLVSSRLLVHGSSLWLFRVLEEDEGEYTCTKGTNLTNFYLEVLGESLPLSSF